MLRRKLIVKVVALVVLAIVGFQVSLSSTMAQSGTGYIDADVQLITIPGQYPDAVRMCGSGQVYVFVSRPPGMQTGRYYHITNLYLMGSPPPGSPAVGAVSYCIGGCSGQFRNGSYNEISGCPGAPPQQPASPPQVSFTVDQNNLTLGQCATLRWDVDNVRAVYYNSQGVAGHDSRRECPQSTTTYTLRAVTNSGDINRSVTVNVQVPAPQVVFSADQTVITWGECTTLHWALAYVQGMSLDSGSISNPGTRQVCPRATTTYTLRAGSSYGDIVRTITVQVFFLINRLTPRSTPTQTPTATATPLPFNFGCAGFGQCPGAVTPTSTPSLDARQIRFSVKGGTFTSLKIVGMNQYGIMTNLEKNFDSGQYFFDTTDYWWLGTIVLSFNVTNIGMRGCVLDYLKPTTAGDFTPVMYTEGTGCSGEGGSGQSDRVLVQYLYAGVFSEEDSLKISGAVMTANDVLQCGYAILTGYKGPAAIIHVGKECINAGLDVVNEVLKKFNKSVVLDTQQALAQSNPTLTPVTDTPVPTSFPTAVPPTPTVPPPPPGVYVTQIRIEPPNPNVVEDVRFFATFWNTAGPLQFKWCVYIFNAGAQNPRGQTACNSLIDFPLGTYEYSTPNTWKLGPGTPCTDLIARVQGIETNGNHLIFKTPDFSENSFPFRVCP